MRRSLWAALIAALLALSLGVAACGGDDESSESAGGGEESGRADRGQAGRHADLPVDR